MADDLRSLLDRQAIVDVTVAYAWILDHGPHERLRDVFTADARAVLGEECRGVDSIIDRVGRALGPLDGSQHIVANHQVSVDGDRATCRCYFHAQHTLRGTPGGDNYVVAGRYDDRLVRTDAGWRIEDRVLTVDWTEGNLRGVQAAARERAAGAQPDEAP